MQRLFTTFAGGCPGFGLLLQRLLIGIALLYYGVASLIDGGRLGSTVPSLVGAAAGILLLVGLWTPVAGASVAVVQVWMIFSRTGNPWISLVLGTLAATVSMIGPGAWSIDAHMFGRKHLRIPVR